MIDIVESTIDHFTLVERVRSRAAGAVCSFLGTAREFTGERRTKSLEYEAYRAMALKKMAEIDAEARRRWPIVESAIVHRVGVVELGEISVLIAVSCPHRAQAFEACRYLIDALKECVPIWKKETWAEGDEEWIHPGLDDPRGDTESVRSAKRSTVGSNALSALRSENLAAKPETIGGEDS